MTSRSPQGKIITFYSYKGGTGRSMALANVAWLLASSGKKVLCVDWDLEAPGLHRYFSPFLVDKNLANSDGLINFIDRYANETFNLLLGEKEVPADWYEKHATLSSYAVPIKSSFPAGGFLDLIPAGRQIATYSTLVNLFDWKDLYQRLGGRHLFEAVKTVWREDYDYILIDSRTGVSDTSGICTVQMPDALVVCFTYNNQSIQGASAITRDIFEKRAQQEQLAAGPVKQTEPAIKFQVFPIPTRVEQAEQDKLNARRRYAWSLFDPFLTYLGGTTERRIYWHEVEVPSIPFFAFEELLAPFKEEMSDPRSLLASLLRLTTRIAQALGNESLTVAPTLVSPEERQRILLEFAQTPEALAGETATQSIGESDVDAQVRMAEMIFTRLTVEEQTRVRRFLPRLVRVAQRGGGEHSRSRVSLEELELSQINPLLLKLKNEQLLALVNGSDAETIMVELASEALIRNWTRLRGWIEEDRDFLVWRQKLDEAIQIWEKSGRLSDFAYGAYTLEEARIRMAERRNDLNKSELAFIKFSNKLEAETQKNSVAKPGGGRHVFIIRPSGKKRDRKGDEIDFDQVEEKLIRPALNQLDLMASTSGDFLRAGNIREDMLRLLLTASLVIVDVSIDSANIFYELGVRHALRDKRTLLLRCRSDDIPFDLKTDRYFSYDNNNPAAALGNLVEALKATIISDVSDSPIFKLFPELEVREPSQFSPVPIDFREEVDLALMNGFVGDFEMLAEEATGFNWKREGLRLVARAQFKLRAFSGAQRSWEGVREFDPDDLEANQKLAMIYQRLGDLSKSDVAVERVLKRTGLNSYDRAEVRSLRGSNEKTRWRADWEQVPSAQQPQRALRSAFLQKALNVYQAAFEESLDHNYAGINALAMRVIQAKLAEALPDEWAERFETDEEAQRELDSLRKQIEKLTAAVEYSIQATRKRKQDIWTEVSEAQRVLLTSTRPARVATAYRQALVDAEPFVADAERRQLRLYQRLGILEKNVSSALEVLPPDKTATLANKEVEKRVILFAGHMLDKPGRVPPRFPPEKEDVARQAIRDAILAEQQEAGGIAYGIAGGSHGGDLLFHEVCAELGIETKLWLALPPDQYVRVAVQNYVGVGTDKLVQRFRQLQNRLTPRCMADELELPRWLRTRPNYDFWQRHTLWMIYNALAVGSENLTLIALWNGETGNGTADFVQRIRERGGKVIVIDTWALFGLST
jgi:MinD-like ATPase involved in chromosome partitioning or flagellar assembly